MTGKIAPKLPDDNDPLQQYSKGMPQNGQNDGTNPTDFQSYMNDGLTQGAQSSTSPMDMMSQVQNSNFGPPGTSSGFAAPENFGPPGIAQASDSQGSSFGNPNNNQNGNTQGSSSTPANFGPPPPAAPPTSGNGQANNLGANQGGGDGGVGGAPAKDKKHTYADVEKMEANAMLNNAMQQMKVKDPDPSAWK